MDVSASTKSYIGRRKDLTGKEWISLGDFDRNNFKAVKRILRRQIDLSLHSKWDRSHLECFLASCRSYRTFHAFMISQSSLGLGTFNQGIPKFISSLGFAYNANFVCLHYLIKLRCTI